MPIAHSNGYEIYYETSGHGLPVVLMHSFLCNGEMWSGQVSALAAHYKVINIDLRGHGKSSEADRPLDIYDLVGDVLAVLDAEGEEKAVWAGLSIGGMIALRAALVAENRVAGLLLLDSHAGTETRIKTLKYRTMVFAAKLFGIEAVLPRVSQLMFGTHTLKYNPQLVEAWKLKFAATSLVSITNLVAALVERDSLAARLGQIQKPAKVIVGEEDVSLPPACSERMAKELPDASLEIIKNAGHLSSLEQPQAIAAAMLTFLQQYFPVKNSGGRD